MSEITQKILTDLKEQVVSNDEYIQQIMDGSLNKSNKPDFDKLVIKLTLGYQVSIDELKNSDPMYAMYAMALLNRDSIFNIPIRVTATTLSLEYSSDAELLAMMSAYCELTHGQAVSDVLKHIIKDSGISDAVYQSFLAKLKEVTSG